MSWSREPLQSEIVTVTRGIPAYIGKYVTVEKVCMDASGFYLCVLWYEPGHEVVRFTGPLENFAPIIAEPEPEGLFDIDL